MDKKKVSRNWTAEETNLFCKILEQKAFKNVFHKGSVWGDTQRISREIVGW